MYDGEMKAPLTDDLVHVPGPEPLWREGYYFEFSDPATGRFGYANIGKLPNKGRAGYLICVWDPDHGLLVGQERDTFEAHTDDHRVGGLSIDCTKPFEEWRISFEGVLVRVPRIGERRHRPPAEIPEDERVTVPTTFNITWRSASPPHAFDPSQEEWSALFQQHHEQLGSSTGTLKAGDVEWALSDWAGIRDHTWGPRDWMQVDTWRWVACMFEAPPHASLWQLSVAGSSVLDGALYWDGRAVPLAEYKHHEQKTPSEDGTPAEPKTMSLLLRDTDGGVLEVSGKVRAMLPMKFRDKRRPGMIHWNDRCIVEFDGPQGRGIGTVEVVSFVEEAPRS
jgi:hypothetical protein